MEILRFIKTIPLIALLIGIFGVCTVADAGSVNGYVNGSWLAFSWYGGPTEAHGCLPADPDGLGCISFGDAVAADAPPWTLDVGPAGASFTITDVANTGDQFELFDNGFSLGVTSDPIANNSCGYDPNSNGYDPDVCLADPNASSGVFLLEEGYHELTIFVLDGSSSAGLGYFRVDGVSAIPIPATAWLFGSGLLGLIGMLRRKKA